MRVDRVQIGGVYEVVVDRTRVPVKVRVVREEPYTTFSAAGSRTQRAFRLARIDTGVELPKPLTAHALREVG